MSPVMSLSALPPNAFAASTPAYNAYNSCVDLEAMSSWGAFVKDLDTRIGNPSLEVFMFDNSPRVAGRTLGYALCFAPNDIGRDCVAREVNACHGDIERLAGLAHLYIYGLIRVFKNPKGPTPTITADQRLFCSRSPANSDLTLISPNHHTKPTTKAQDSNGNRPRSCRYSCGFEG
ncbi:hypothetical protein B0H12DRAFT_1229005 [Mycena haematopus]|nr:hypothetical protein B0H12DRAFT_1229005 [Mycena haematopus]